MKRVVDDNVVAGAVFQDPRELFMKGLRREG